MLTYLKTEILRVLRNRRYVLFALVVPLGFYLLFGKLGGGNGTVRGVGVTTFFMVSMAAYSAMLAVVFMGGARRAAERTRGWTQLLRVTPLPAWGYLATKLVAARCLALPAIVLVAITAAIGVRSAWAPANGPRWCCCCGLGPCRSRCSASWSAICWMPTPPSR